MKKSPPTYVRFDYKLEQIETDQGMEWYATYPEFPGVCGGGKTKQEAIDDLAENLFAHIDLARENKLGNYLQLDATWCNLDAKGRTDG